MENKQYQEGKSLRGEACNIFPTKRNPEEKERRKGDEEEEENPERRSTK